MVNKNEKLKYYSTGELAEKMGVSRIAVFKMIKNGRIPAQRAGRNYIILADTAEDFISGGKLTEKTKHDIAKGVERVVKEYGEVLKMLGKE